MVKIQKGAKTNTDQNSTLQSIDKQMLDLLNKSILIKLKNIKNANLKFEQLKNGTYREEPQKKGGRFK